MLLPNHKKTTTSLLAILAMLVLAPSGTAQSSDCSTTALYDYLTENHTCYFSDLSESDQGSTIVAWSWDLGDGTISSIEQPTYAYQEYGTYTCCLTVFTEHSDGSYCESVFCQDIIIEPSEEQEPVCALEAGFNHEPLLNGIVAFESNCVVATGTEITGQGWTFGVEGGSNLANPTFQFSDASHYDVCLTVQGQANGQGCESTICEDVNVDNFICELFPEFKVTPMVCNTRFTYNGDHGEFTNVDQFLWDMGDGTIIDGGLQVDYNYEVEGTYDVCLTVIGSCPGNECEATYCQTVNFSCEIEDEVNIGLADSDEWKDDTTLALSIVEKETGIRIGVYPNPASDHLTISADQPIQFIRIYSMTGTLVMNVIVNADYRNTLSVDELASGNYIVSVGTNDLVTSEMLSINK